MNCNLTEMLATAHRDELRRKAARHNRARQARRDLTGSGDLRFFTSVRSVPVAWRRSQVRPAIAS